MRERIAITFFVASDGEAGHLPRGYRLRIMTVPVMRSSTVPVESLRPALAALSYAARPGRVVVRMTGTVMLRARLADRFFRLRVEDVEVLEADHELGGVVDFELR